jgi:hypothetical protein
MRFLLLLGIFYSYSILAVNCNSLSPAPLCPDSGSTILDETYPTQAFVVSVQGYQTSSSFSSYSQEPDNQLPANFIISILQSYNTDTPEIIVPAAKSEFEELIKKIQDNLLKSGLSPLIIQKQLSSIKHVDAQSYTWQQDYFESFISPDTGRPVVREVSSYGNLSSMEKSASINGFKSKSDGCAIEIGRPLKDFKGTKGGDPKTTSWGNGEMGGNIEGLPGGLCLKGNNQAEEFVSQYCGPRESGNAVEVDVGWMVVGHVDEIIKVVPVFPKKTPEECNFSIWLASPRLGIEVLREPGVGSKKFIDHSDLTESEFNQKLHDIIITSAGKELCSLLKDFVIDEGKDNGNVPSSKAKGAYFWHFFSRGLIQNSYADDSGGSTANNCSKKLANITNGEMASLMEKNKYFQTMNNLVQEKMDANRMVIDKKIKERLPQCKEIKFVEVPDLFYGHGLAEVDGKTELPEPGNARSLFPNPTNSVLANQTMIVPMGPNLEFNLHVKNSLANQGLKSKFVDTWNYAHSGDGNMHCSSHSLTYCSPRGKK